MGRVTDGRGWEEGKQKKGEDRNEDRYGAGFETQQGWWLGVCSAQPCGRATGSSPPSSVLLQKPRGKDTALPLQQASEPKQERGQSAALQELTHGLIPSNTEAWQWLWGPKPGSWWRLWEPCPLLAGVFPPAHEAWALEQRVLAEGVHSRASPRHTLEDPLALPQQGALMPVSQSPCSAISDFLCGSGQNGKGIFLPSWREAAHSRKASLPNPTVLCPASAQIWSSQLHSFHLTGFPLPFHTPYPICSAVLPPPVLPGSCSCSQQGSITWAGFFFPLHFPILLLPTFF